MELREEVRENWGTRAGFVLAAIGSAVGLGNLWGFPYKLYSYGQGAFLIPYVIAMLLIGLPLMIVEFSLGHMSQRAAPHALRQVSRRSEFVGWWQIILGFVIITFYAVILAWCVSYLWYSIDGIFHGGQLPWAGEGMEGVKKAGDFFNKTYLNKSDSLLGSLQWPIVAALLVTWIFMYFCVFRGVKLVSKIVLWTVPLPWLMLAILTVRGLTLNGADRGLELYLEPNWAQLTKPETWRWAFGQTFFSLSLAFGVMVTYASFLHRKSDLNNNAAIIGLADLGTSFIAGLAVFATLGGMATAAAAAGHPVPVREVVDGGPGLAFVAFPYALAQLPYSAWFSLIFFLALLTLGIDSAFSITESVIAGFVDKTGWRRGRVVLVVHAIGFGVGLIYCTRGGLGWLGAMDGFINGPYGILLLGLMECLVVGWLFRLSRLRKHANERSDWKLGAWWDVLVRGVIPVILSALIVWQVYENLADPAGFVRSYKSDPVAVAVPPADVVADSAKLQLQVATPGFKAKPVAKAVLSDKADSHKNWQLSAAVGQPTTLPDAWTPQQAAGTALTYTAAGLPPATRLQARYRWTADEYLGEEPWTELPAFTTTRHRAGWHIHNLVGAIIFALAPLAAIAFMFVRFRNAGDDDGPARASAGPAVGRAAGVLSLLLAVAAVALTIAVAAPVLRIDALHRLGEPPAAEQVRSAWLLIGGALGCGLLGLLIGGGVVGRADRTGQRPAATARFGGILGAVGGGGGGGLGLALLTLVHKFEVHQAVRDQKLSSTSYIVMAVALALIVGGLCWCFYRAFKASSAGAEEQTAET